MSGDRELPSEKRERLERLYQAMKEIQARRQQRRTHRPERNEPRQADHSEITSLIAEALVLTLDSEAADSESVRTEANETAKSAVEVFLSDLRSAPWRATQRLAPPSKARGDGA